LEARAAALMNMSEEERARVYALMSPEIAMRAQYDCGRFIEEKEKIKKKARKGWKMIKERKVSTVTKDFFRHEPKAVKMPNGGWAFVSAAA